MADGEAGENTQNFWGEREGNSRKKRDRETLVRY